MIAYVYGVILRRVVDATTFEIACNFNLRDPCRQRVRLAHIEAIGEGEAATAWVEAWIKRHTVATPPGFLLSLQEERPDGRACLVGRLFAPDGAMLNRDMYQAGLARLVP